MTEKNSRCRTPRPGIAERINGFPKKTLADVVTRIVGALYWDSDTGKYQPDLEWDEETIENVAEVLIRHQLRPKRSKEG